MESDINGEAVRRVSVFSIRFPWAFRFLMAVSSSTLALESGIEAAATWPVYQHDLGQSGQAEGYVGWPYEPAWSTQILFDGVSDDGQLGRVVSDGTMAYIGSNSFHIPPISTEDMSIWALRLSDGSVEWETNVFGGVVVCPQIAGDHIVAGVHDTRNDTDEDLTSTLWVLNRSDGSVAWTHPFTFAGEDVRCGLPAAADGVVVVAVEGYDTGLMGLHAFRQSDGFPLWFYPGYVGLHQQRKSIPPCIQDGRVYCVQEPGGYDVRCLDLQTGAEIWIRDQWHGSPLTVSNQVILVGGGRVYFSGAADGTTGLFCVDAVTGGEIWRTGSISVGALDCLALGSDTLYALGGTGWDLGAYSLADGSEIMAHDLSPAGQILTVASDGSVFLQQGMDFTVYEPGLSAVRYLFDHPSFNLISLGGLTILDGRCLMPFPDNCVGTLRGDITPPAVTFTHPETATVVNPGSSITIRSTIIEFNKIWWVLEYAPLHDQSTWTEIDSERDFTTDKTTYTSWSLSEIPDGEWIVRIVVTDEAGLTGQDTFLITLDRTRPESEITSPTDGSQLNTLAIEVQGTASDNMAIGFVEIWDSVSGQWHRAVGRESWSHEWIGALGCQEVTFRSRATDWAGNVEATPHSEVTVNVAADVEIIPIYPSSHTIPSEVMQGGTLHRLVLVADADGNPIGGARIYYANTLGGEEYAVADSNGIVNLDVWTQDIDDHTDPIESVVQAMIDVTRVRSGGSGGCDMGALEPWPEIPVEIRPRDAQHFWTAGLGGSLKAGITAYVTGSAGGGTRLEIDAAENVCITQSWDVGLGVGVEFGMDEDLGIAEIGASAGAEANLLLRGDEAYGFGQALCGDLDDSACRERRQAYASVMIASLARNAMVLSNPVVDKIIGALTAAIYNDWIESLSVAGGMSLEANAGISSSIGLESNEGTEGSLDLSLIDGSIEMAFLVGMRAYPQEERVGFLAIQEIATSLNALTFSAFGNDMVSATEFFDLEGANTDFTFTEEVIFDSLDVPREFIFTISDGEGEVRYIFDDFDAVQQIVEHSASNVGALADSFNPTTGGGLQLGFEACRNELCNLFLLFQTVPCRIERSEMAEESSFDFGLALDFNIQVITVGGALEVSYTEGREWTAEEIVFDGFQRHTIATYTRDSFVDHDDHTLGDLLSATLDGLWTHVLDAVDWIGETVDGWADWTLDTFSPGAAAGQVGTLADYPDGPWLRLSGAANSFSGAQDLAIISLSPEANPIQGLTVFGQIHNLQPEDLTLLKPVTLEIGYGDPVLPTGADEADLDVYLWNNTDERWQEITGAAMSSPEHARTAMITAFGTFAVGIDLTSPEIHLLPPASEGFAPLNEDIIAEVFDLVSDIASTEATLDGQPLALDHDAVSRLLAITLPGGLAAGTHHLVITACDTAGNCGTLERDIIFESTPPTAEIVTPTEGETVSGTVQIVGTASDAHFGFYTVQMIGNTTPGQWWIGVPSETAVVNGTLAEFDTSMIPNDTYTITLRVVDAAGQETIAERTVDVVNVRHVVDYLLGHTSDHRGCDANEDDQIDAADIVEIQSGI